MNKYLCVSRGPATPMADFTPEQQAEQMEAWGQWITRLGPSLADIGTPFGARTALADDGTSPAPSDLNGYSIFEADSLDPPKPLPNNPPLPSDVNTPFTLQLLDLSPL